MLSRIRYTHMKKLVTGLLTGGHLLLAAGAAHGGFHLLNLKKNKEILPHLKLTSAGLVKPEPYRLTPDKDYESFGIFTHEVEPTFVLFRNSEWSRDEAMEYINSTAEIFSQCGLKMSGNLLVVDAVNGEEKVHGQVNEELAKMFDQYRPAVFLFESNWRQNHGAYCFISEAESELRGTAWISSDYAERMGDIAIAHELTHIMEDTQTHEDMHNKGNLMTSTTNPASRLLTDGQCQDLLMSKYVKLLAEEE